MPIEARRIFRTSLGTALALAAGYALALPLPYFAPLFVLMLSATPAPPIGARGLAGLMIAVLVTLGGGLLLIPVLLNYPLTALLLIAAGLYSSTYLSVHREKGLLGMLLTVGLTLIPAAGTVDFALAIAVIDALCRGIAVAICCQWAVYPLFPEDPRAATAASATAPLDATQSHWISLRTVLIVLPPFLLTLTNPLMYLPLIIKTVLLGRQGSAVSARDAGRELLGSTFLGGCFAMLFWFALGIVTSLWMYFWWMLLFGIFLTAKMQRTIATRLPASFWLNVAVTMLILLGPAVEDSASGKDVYAAFAVRMGLFIAVTLYACTAVFMLERLRSRRPLPSPSTLEPR